MPIRYTLCLQLTKHSGASLLVSSVKRWCDMLIRQPVFNIRNAQHQTLNTRFNNTTKVVNRKTGTCDLSKTIVNNASCSNLKVAVNVAVKVTVEKSAKVAV